MFRYLTISKTPDHDLLEILQNNVIGTPGQSMLYQHTQVSQKIKLITKPYFVNLIRAEKIAGTCCFCARETLNKGVPVQSFYVRYFSFKDIFRRRSIREKVSGRNSLLRREVQALLSGNGLGANPDQKFFHYAYVDPRNERSAVLCKEFGFETVRHYTTIVFSRLNPKMQAHKIIELNTTAAEALLKSHYQHFNFLTFENLVRRKYYALEDEQGHVVVGVQVNPDQWRIHAMPGFLSNLLLPIFTNVPFLNRLLNKNFRFLTFEGIYFIPGQEKYLEQLFESLLAKYQVYTGICIVDDDSVVYGALQSIRLGLLNKLNREVKGNVICRFQNFSEGEKSVFRMNPAYISGIDAT